MKKVLWLTSMAAAIFFLFVVISINYFTGFGYYLPHRPMVIYTLSGDVTATAEPKYIAITNEPPADSIIANDGITNGIGWNVATTDPNTGMRIKDLSRVLKILWDNLPFNVRYEAFIDYCNETGYNSEYAPNWQHFDYNGGYIK